MGMNFKQDINERRRSVRVDFRVPVEVHCSETATSLKGLSVNLSIHGMLLELQEKCIPLEIGNGNAFNARLIFQGKGSKLMIDELQFTIVRIKNNKLATEFIIPLEWFLLFTVYKSKQIHN